jgi:hypothetical protein
MTIWELWADKMVGIGRNPTEKMIRAICLAAWEEGRASQRGEIGRYIKAIYLVATGNLDRGTPEERLAYIADTAKIMLSKLEKESKEKPDEQR